MLFPDRIIPLDLENSAVWIAPGMKLHTSFMRFPDHKFERVIEWNRCLPLLACQPFTPGSKAGREKSITCRPYLHDHGIHAIALMHIELTNELCLLQICIILAAGGPVDIVNCCHPNSPEFIFGLGKSELRKKQANKKRSFHRHLTRYGFFS